MKHVAASAASRAQRLALSSSNSRDDRRDGNFDIETVDTGHIRSCFNDGVAANFSSEGDRRFGPDVERYLSELRTKPVLSPVEEADLAEQARAGDEEGLLQWIDSYLFMTASIALRLCPPAMSPLEAIQEANAVLTHLLRAGETRSPIAELGRSIEEHFDQFRRPPPSRS